MNKVVTVEEAVKISKKLKKERKHIVLVGGCFDILHVGHIEFLKKAKELGDFLFVFLESNESVCREKGENRPIHNQKGRAKVLASLPMVDYIVLLLDLKTDNEYKNLVTKIKPDIIAVTSGDRRIKNKIEQAKPINAKVVKVIKRISKHSTTRLIKLLSEKK